MKYLKLFEAFESDAISKMMNFLKTKIGKDSQKIFLNRLIKIKDTLENNRDRWSIPSQTIKCADCGHEDSISVVLDQSNFFG